MHFDRFCFLLLLVSLGVPAQTTTLVPNPFSPGIVASAEGNQEPGLAIRLFPASDTTWFARVHIYNTQGTLVRAIVPGVWVPPQGWNVYWDGRSDDGKMARNGRYVVVTQWSHSGTGKPFLVQRHSLVVFK